MQFTSLEFLCLFLPLTGLLYFILGRANPRWGIVWLTAASLFFYAWWRPGYLLLLGGSILVNYWTGRWLMKLEDEGRPGPARRVLAAGLVFNVLLLGYYKYFGFLTQNVDRIFGSHFPVPEIMLPLGISFFTFTQIAFLVDAYQGKVREVSGVNYTLFVSYFPHLMAGPILHHQEMMPQFARPEAARLRWSNIGVGLSLFTMGLAKKVLVADNVAPYADRVFTAVAQGGKVGIVEAWGGALAFTLQLYFDFSGYSDMAIGLSRLFGIRLPLNFNSPYKARDIIDFWRRWHMTLSRFLRDYVYIPLGGNRHGTARRHVNLLATMLLGGIWHGAGWTFLVWGGLHGLYLVANHAWNHATGQEHPRPRPPAPWRRLVAGALTFVCVTVGWVVFKSPDMASLGRYLSCMADPARLGLPWGWRDHLGALQHVLPFHHHVGKIWHGLPEPALVIPALLAVVWFFPNSQQIFGRYRPALGFPRAEAAAWPRWKPVWYWALVLGALALACLLILITSQDSLPFLYFRF